MGETPQPFQLSFNASLRVAFRGSQVTSDGGLILLREIDEQLGLRELIEEQLTDPAGGRIPSSRWRIYFGAPCTVASARFARRLVQMIPRRLA